MKTLALLMVLATFVLSGCLKTRSEVEEAEQEKVIAANVNQLQRASADQEVRFQDIDAEFRNLSGRIEIVEQKLNLSKESGQQNQKTLDQRLQKLEELTVLLQQAIEKNEAQIASLASDVKKLNERSRKKSTSKPKKKLGNYAGAEQAFSRKQWRDAILGYQKYLELNPKGKVAHMATYKIGVSFQELKMKDEAKTFYQLAVDKFPKSEGAKRSKYRLKNL